ncbi:energy-coupling factor ABC transporter permease [Aquipuribacter hungaricus]|uniref:Energy-coupling factor ABC transporter permease n=1 Tax=Aquipuribacter hungaricus TaxID=545624 RepID=A0ABV7WJI5_9MICO
MHVPDGFLDLSTSLATGAASVGVVAVSLRRARAELAESTAAAPMAGLVSAFVFAVQMLNFPVGIGTSGHLMGGALAAALVGPWTAVICLAVVVSLQALLFADGGVSALGTNVFLIGIVTVVVGYLVSRAVMAVLPGRASSAVPAAAVGALVSVPATALVFVGLYAVGGAAELDLGQLTAFMLTWHVAIGVGEAVITGLTVGAVVATRPDLVRLARRYRTNLVVTSADGQSREVTATPVADGVRRIGLGWVAGALGVCLVLAGGVSSWASANPDGLEYVADRMGFLGTAEDSAASGSPFGDYAVAGIDNPYLATGLAGVVGVLVALGIALLVARLVRPSSAPRDDRTSEKV